MGCVTAVREFPFRVADRSSETFFAGMASEMENNGPNGRAVGLMPWIIWFLGSLCFFFAFFQRVTPGVMTEELMRDFAVTATVVGNITAFYYYAYASIQIPIGVMVDRWGPRWMLTVAIALSAVGGLIFAATENLWLAYLGRMLIGAGSAVGWVGSLKLISIWFPARRFAFLSGMTSTFGMLGAIAGQAPVAAMVNYFGWRPTLVIIAAMALGLAALIGTVVRDRPSGGCDATTHSMPELMQGLRGILKTRQTWVLAVLCGMLTAPQAAFAAVWGVPYLMQTFDLSRVEAAGTASFLILGWGIGSPLGGWFSDLIGRRKLPLLLGALIALTTISCVIYIPGLPLSAVRALLLINGIGSASMVLCFVAAREHNVVEAGSAAVGFVNMATMGLSAVSQPLIGWILDINWNGQLANGVRVYDTTAFKWGMLTLVGCGVFAVIAALLVRETHCRPLGAAPFNRPERPDLRR